MAIAGHCRPLAWADILVVSKGVGMLRRSRTGTHPALFFYSFCIDFKKMIGVDVGKVAEKMREKRSKMIERWSEKWLKMVGKWSEKPGAPISISYNMVQVDKRGLSVEIRSGLWAWTHAAVYPRICGAAVLICKDAA